jgi:hypothetical protein
MGSPKLAAKPCENLIARDKLDFTSVDLSDSTLDFDPPGFVGPDVSFAVEGFDQRKREFGSLSLLELSRLLL